MVMELRPASLDLPEFDREEFIHERWDYHPGEHVTFLAPTQTGKTTLKFQLLQRTATPKLPAMVLVMKPRDKVVDDWQKTLKFQRTESWPPVAWKRKFTNPPGWMIRPEHRFDPKVDNEHLRRVFRRAILSAYKKGDRIIDVDELYGVDNELGLDDELNTVYSRGASMGCGQWGGSQRPRNVTLYAYSQAQHLFLGNTPDKADRERFRDIGGVDARDVSDIVMDLGDHEWLYINRSGPRMCKILAA